MQQTSMGKRLLSMAAAAVLAVSCVALPIPVPQAESKIPLPYMDTDLSFEERAADLVSRMTLEEKIGQLGNNAGTIARLGVSAYNYWSEGLHGVARSGEATSFPYSIALAASWDPALTEEITTAIGDEARGYANGKGKGLSYWSPTINMARDPRWGRNQESYGEDPYLTTAIGAAFVNGLQGDDPTYLKTIATIKHYAANNREQGRNSTSSNMEDTVLREYYTRAFRGIARTTEVGSVMSSYNRVNETPSSANVYLLDTLLRKTFGFTGYVTSDCGAIENVYNQHQWHPDGWDRAVTAAEAVYYCLLAGCDIDCGEVYKSNAMDAVKAGLLSEDLIDLSLVRLFTARMKTGEFDPTDMVPYRSAEYSFAKQVENDAHKLLAETSANDAIVLLKNEKNLLPLNKDQKNIVMIGSDADEVVLGDYSGTPTVTNTYTPIQGMEALGATVTHIENGASGDHAQNGTYIGNMKNIILHKADATTVELAPSAAQELSSCKVENGGNNIGNVYPGASLVFKGVNIEGVTSVTFQIARPAVNTLNGTVTVTMDSKQGMRLAAVDTVTTDGWQAYVDLTCDVSDLGGATVKDLYVTFSQKLEDVSFSAQETEQIKAADAVVVCLNGVESKEGSDRSTIAMPEYQVSLANTVAGLNKNTIVYMQMVGATEIEGFKNNVPAILWTYANGQAQGLALARILYGEANPTAKLPFTWYADNRALPAITNYEIREVDGSNGWTYQYYSGAQTYPFGYGLSYSSYRYSNLTVTGASYQMGDVDGKNDITAVDALLALQAATKKITLSHYQQKRADVDGEDGVSVIDALMILQASAQKIALPTVEGGAVTPDDTVTVTVDVTNESSVDGKEIVELYVKSPKADGVNRPLKQLKAFDKVAIAAGKTETVTLTVDLADCYFWDEDLQKNVYDQGEYTVFVGPSADEDTALSAHFTMDGELTPELTVVTLKADGVTLNAADPDKVITSELTATMSDDTFYDLANGDANVTYTSSNESVARVDNHGVVSAVGGGVATITASVTMGGKTMTSSFPVAVIVRLSNIQVDGVDLDGFRPDKTEYYLPVKGSTPPVVTVHDALAPYVSIQNATAVPGDATVTITMSNVTNVYTIHFTARSTDYVAASFSKFNNTYTTDGKQSFYAEWSRVDGHSVDLTNHTLSDLHLRLKVEIKRLGNDSSGYTDAQVFENGYIKLRSHDTPGENNVGWSVKALNLKTGVNYIDIPLTQTANYSTGNIDWTTLDRIHFAIFSVSGRGSYEFILSDTMIVDTSLDQPREELWGFFREEISEYQYLEPSLIPYRAAKEAIAALLFQTEPLTVEEAATAKNAYLEAKAGLKKDTYLMGTFAKSEGTWTVLHNGTGTSLYNDWKDGDDIPLDLSGDRSNLRLQMTVRYQSATELVNAADVWSNLTIKLRSSDVESKPGDPNDTDPNKPNKEHNYGWDIRPVGVTDRENLRISIDLSSACTNSRGLIDWSDIRRMIVISDLSKAALAAGVSNDQFSMVISDIKIVDLTDVYVEQAAIKDLLAEQVDTVGAAPELVQAYHNAYTVAEAMSDTEWVSLSQTMQARADLQAAIDALR